MIYYTKNRKTYSLDENDLSEQDKRYIQAQKLKIAKIMRAQERKYEAERRAEAIAGICPQCYQLRPTNGHCPNCE